MAIHAVLKQFNTYKFIACPSIKLWNLEASDTQKIRELPQIAVNIKTIYYCAYQSKQINHNNIYYFPWQEHKCIHWKKEKVPNPPKVQNLTKFHMSTCCVLAGSSSAWQLPMVKECKIYFIYNFLFWSYFGQTFLDHTKLANTCLVYCTWQPNICFLLMLATVKSAHHMILYASAYPIIPTDWHVTMRGKLYLFVTSFNSQYLK